MAEELLKIERTYSNPPRQNEQNAVRGLRGGVAVLVVASFENFLKISIEEHLSKLTIYPLIPFSNLPDPMKVSSTYKTLELAMKGNPFEESTKLDRLTEIEAACKKVIVGIIDPTAFTFTGGNPIAKNIKSMLKDIDIKDIFNRIEPKFTLKWRRPISHTFLIDKLNEIVSRRHIVAHTASALSITRNQLKESIRFLKILAELIDNELKNKINQILSLRTP
jgi:hypothetical protein